MNQAHLFRMTLYDLLQPERFNIIFSYGFVGCNERQIFCSGLSNHDPIERVSMNCREPVCLHNVLRPDWKYVEQLEAAQKRLNVSNTVLPFGLDLAFRHFYENFPDGRRA